MPRIPTSKPDRAPRRPSVGGQVDIRSQDAFFRSIASASEEVGAIIENARVEKQKLLDSRALNQWKIRQISESAELKNALTPENIDQHNEIIDTWVSKQRSTPPPQSMSKEAKEQFQQESNLWIESSIASGSVFSAQALSASEQNTANTLLSVYVDEMNLPLAFSVIDGMGITDSEKAALKKKAEFNVGSAIIANNEKAEGIIVEQIETSISEAQTTEDVPTIRKAIDESNLDTKRQEALRQRLTTMEKSLYSAEMTAKSTEYAMIIDDSEDFEYVESVIEAIEKDPAFGGTKGEAAKNRLIKTANSRKRSIITQAEDEYQKQLKLAGDRLEEISGGELVDLTAATQGISDPELKSILQKAFVMGSGTIGIEDEGYKSLSEDLEDGYWFYRTEARSKKRVEDFLTDPNRTMQAKVSIAIKAVDAVNSDASGGTLKSYIQQDENGNLNWTGGLLKIDDSQKFMIKSASGSIDKLIRAGAKSKDWTKAGISPAGIKRVFRAIHDPEFIDKFKGLNPKEADELFRKEFYGEEGLIGREMATTVGQLYRNLVYNASTNK